MKNKTYLFLIFLSALLISNGAAAQNNGNNNEGNIVHSLMTADQEDYDSLGCDTISFVPSTGEQEEVFGEQALRRRLETIVEHPMLQK